jgi:hypothetical protein
LPEYLLCWGQIVTHRPCGRLRRTSGAADPGGRLGSWFRIHLRPPRSTAVLMARAEPPGWLQPLPSPSPHTSERPPGNPSP